MKHFNKMLKDLEKIFSKNSKNQSSPDEGKPINEMATSKGYPFEEHKVITSDGYALTLFRIPGAKCETDYVSKPKQPILFQHGLLDSADCWLCNEESRCLPYIFANSGMDVWLSNSRGNKYCKEHVKFRNDSFEFWQFSLHEMGHDDLPTVLEYINTKKTCQEKIIYIGHSQGTAMLFAALSSNQDMFKYYIKLFVALAPVARIKNMSSGLLKFIQGSQIDKLFNAIKVNEIFPDDKHTGEFNAFVNKHWPKLSNMGLSLISDSNSAEVNSKKQLGVYMTHYPSGTSWKCLNHFNQISIAKKFIKYDYQDEANMFIYKQLRPTEYDLTVINNFPIMLIGGQEDQLACPEDVKWLSETLGSNVIYHVSEPSMGHVTFLIGKSIEWLNKPYEIILSNFTLNEHKYN